MARQGKTNADLSNRECATVCALDDKSLDLLDLAVERLGLSARSYYRVLRMARTIADLTGQEAVAPAHLSEAIGYRRLDRSSV